MQASINNNKKLNCSINNNQKISCSVCSGNNIQADTCAKNDINANSTQRGPQGIPGEAATIQLGTVTTGAAGSDVIITNSGTENAAIFNFTIPRGDRGEQGEQGIQGKTGNGIVSIEKTSTSGLVDTYTITFDNGNTEIFTVTNGQKGDTGSAATISVGSTTTGAAGTSASVVNSGTSSAAVLDFVIPQGVQGETGATGNGISSIAKTSTSGLVDTYTITFTNGTTTTFTVTNGQDGTGASSVSELTDVDLTGLSNGDVLVYDSTSQEWKAEAQSGGIDLRAGTDLEIVADSILPSGYTQLNSITSTGAQYINTGLVLTDNFKAEIVGRFTSTTGTQCVLGVTVATASTTYKNIVLGKSSQYYVNKGNPWYQPQLINSSVPIDTNKHTFVIEITASSTKISVDGVENSASYANFNTDEDLFLFANNAVVAGGSGVTSVTDFAQFEAESVKLYTGGNLVFNGVSASYGNQAGLYDTVSETFMPSLGTSDFVAGSEISQKIINFTNDSGYIKSASVSSLTDVTLSNLTNGQGLIYNSTSQKWENTTIQTSTAWGSITGTLSNQTDLQNALNAKSTVTIVDWTV